MITSLLLTLHSIFKTQKKKFLVFSAMNILHNCSKAAENRQILLDLRAIERISPFLKADDMEIVVTAILTLAYISSDDQKKRLEAESRVSVSYIRFRILGSGQLWSNARVGTEKA